MLTTIGKTHQKIFVHVASSVVCERVFSTSGGILNARRNRLTAENVDMLTFWTNKINFKHHIFAYIRFVVTHDELSEIFQLSQNVNFDWNLS